MKRAIVDYKKLTKDILALLVEKYPEGYQDHDVIRFKNAKNETVEALEVRTEDTIYLVKVSTRLATSMERYDEDEDDYYSDTLEMSREDEIALKRKKDIHNNHFKQYWNVSNKRNKSRNLQKAWRK